MFSGVFIRTAIISLFSGVLIRTASQASKIYNSAELRGYTFSIRLTSRFLRNSYGCKPRALETSVSVLVCQQERVDQPYEVQTLTSLIFMIAVRSGVNDKAAMGVALAAGQATGVELVTLTQKPIPSVQVDLFTPLPDEGERRARYQKWKMAVARSLGWATTTKSTAMTGGAHGYGICGY